MEYDRTKKKHLKLILGFIFELATKTAHRESEHIWCGYKAPTLVAGGFYFCSELKALEDRQLFCTAILCHNKQANVPLSPTSPQYILSSYLVWLHFSYIHWDGSEFLWKFQLLLKIAFFFPLLLQLTNQKLKIKCASVWIIYFSRTD